MSKTLFLDHKFSILLLAAASIVLCYYFFDVPIAKSFESISPELRQTGLFLTTLIDPKYHYIIWPLLFVIAYFFRKKKILASRLLLIALTIPLTNLLVNLLKHLFGRARPELLFSKDIYGFTFFAMKNAYLSFPSGHACTAGVLIGCLTCFYPRFVPLFLIIGLPLAFTRVLLNYHYLSDVIAGLVIGLFVSQFIYLQLKAKYAPSL